MKDVIEIGYRFRESFFDREAVTSRIDRAKRDRLSKAGAFIRRRAQSLIRPPRRSRLTELPIEQQTIFAIRKAQSDRLGTRPPMLPYAPSLPGEPPRTPTQKLPRSIFFALDTSGDAVLTGPVPLSGSRGVAVPTTLEQGGRETIFGKTVTIAARPFMQPALQAELSRLPQLFEGMF